MIQLNLLPDVKLQYLKAQKIRRLTMVVSVMVSLAAVVLLILLLGVDAYQKHTLRDLNSDVSEKTVKLESEPDINNVLTVQNQLQSIDGLHAKEPAANRLFNYLEELVPSTVTVNTLTVDFNADTITIGGDANSIDDINKFVDTLKFTDYNTGNNTPKALAFSEVVLASFGENQETATNTPPANYSITANFNPTIFDATQNISLIVPNIITTRSSLENPGPLFVQGPSSHSDNSSSNNSNGGSE